MLTSERVIKEKSLRIVPILDNIPTPFSSHLYVEMIEDALKNLLPDGFLKNDLPLKKLPLLVKKEGEGIPSTLSFYSLSLYRENAFRFFFEMISRWLIPGARSNVIFVFSAQFTFPDLGPERYMLSEMMIRIEDQETLKLIDKSLPLLESEIKLGLESKNMAQKILEVKGFAQDEKSALLHEILVRRIRRHSNIVDQDIVSEMQHILLTCKEQFKAQRSLSLLSRIIFTQYLFRKELLKHIEHNSHKRHVLIKLIRLPVGDKERIGITAGINFLAEKEVFEERQFIAALHHHFPLLNVCPTSFLLIRRGRELLTTVYLEIEHHDGAKFTDEELKMLKQELPKDLRVYVEHLMHPIFMPRNEEEIMRNILTLSQQIKFARDIPQVFITFDQQKLGYLKFTVIFVRVLKPGMNPLQENFKGQAGPLTFIHDRTKIVGTIRNKHQKEATVFRVKIRKDTYLRLDQSIDLYKARQTVVNELSRVLGEFRDFNGGMISKQSELLIKVKEILHDEKVKFNHVLLENFFYNLMPVIMQTTLEPQALSSLFKMLLECMKKGIQSGKKYLQKVKSDGQFIYVLLMAHDHHVIEEFEKVLHRFRHPVTDLASADLSHGDTFACGYILRSSDEAKKTQFLNAIESVF